MVFLTPTGDRHLGQQTGPPPVRHEETVMTTHAHATTLYELNDAELDTVTGGSSLWNSVKDGAAAIASTVGGTLKAVGEAAACQADPFTCRPA
jgi:hypothetical protein